MKATTFKRSATNQMVWPAVLGIIWCQSLAPAQETNLTATKGISSTDRFTLSGGHFPPISGPSEPELHRRSNNPGANLQVEAVRFRRLHLLDENGEVPTNAWVRAALQTKLLGPKPISTARRKVAGIESSGWAWLGPGNVGGRIRSILINPTETNIMWVGGVDGGVWKTVNAGASWYPLDDFMANLSVSCMAMDPFDPDIIYAGTGAGSVIQGAGIFETVDGGANWVQLSSTASSAFYSVSSIAISPNNHQIILAATATGIYRSSNGGSTWNLQQSKPGSYSAGFANVAFAPGDGTRCIASGYTESMLMYSTDGGVTWQRASGITGAGTIKLAYAPSDPNIAYASVDRNEGEVYRSLDGGHSYSLQNSGTQYLGTTGWNGNCVWVDPLNSSIVVVGGLGLWLSTDAAVDLAEIGVHGHGDDQIIVSPPNFGGTSTTTLFVGNDGGIYVTTNLYQATTSSGWQNLNNNLGITQFYGAVGNASTGTIVGGTQDNGTLRYTTAGGPQAWTQWIGDDGGFCASDPSDTNYFYGEAQLLDVYRSSDGGNSANDISAGIADAGTSTLFIAPLILDPNNPNMLLAGGASLWRTTNVKAATPTWTAIKSPDNNNLISAIAIAPGNSDIIWVGYDHGDIFATANGTALNPSWTQKNHGTPSRYSTRITIDPNNSSVVYATFGGFSSGNVWRTIDGGKTWADISSNLPQAPVNSIVIHPHASNYLYVGTEVGVFASENGGTGWSTGNDGPANVAVYELSWVGNTLLAATFGRGCYSIQPTYWVQYGLSDPGNGTYERPYNTLAAGLTAVPAYGRILFKYPGSTPENSTIAKPMVLGAVGGAATIGH